MAESKITKDFICEVQQFSVSGFDGSMKETALTISLKQGYRAYPLAVEPNKFNKTNFIYYSSDINPTTGVMYIEHNLASNVTYINVSILFVKN